MYVSPYTILHTTYKIEEYEENEKARYAIISYLSKSKNSKVISLKIGSQVWKKLKGINESNGKLKISNKFIGKEIIFI